MKAKGPRAAAALALTVLGACAPVHPATVLAPVPRLPDPPPPSVAVTASPPAPAPAVDPADFDLPVTLNGPVERAMDRFLAHRSAFESWLAREARYGHLIRARLDSAGLPGDLINLALIESGFLPTAESSAGAAGIWQFMPRTARLEGLEVSTYIDERRDPVRSTDAAVRHLKALYRQFGSWYLAAAAYNSGSGRVQRALDATVGGASGQDSLFWAIEPVLPSETREYVPQLVAAAILSRYPDRYGLDAPTPSPQDYDTVEVDKATDLSAIARAADTTADAIRQLNPRFVLGVTPPGRSVSVRVPRGAGEFFAAALARIPASERVRDIEHTVRRGETAAGIASRYRVKLAALRGANHLARMRRLTPGHRLLIPLAPATVTAALQREAVRAASDRHAGRGAGVERYTVREGDTLWGIAHRSGTTVADLRDWNDLSDDAIIHPGDRLRISPPG